MNTRAITVTSSRTIDVPEYSKHLDSYELIDLVKKTGSHFFDDATMRGFRSRLHDVYPGVDGWYFVTSEKHVAHTSYGTINEPRKYTVRRLRINTKGDDLSIDEIGEFQQYPTLGRARTAAKYHAKQGALICDHCGHSPEHADWCYTRHGGNSDSKS